MMYELEGSKPNIHPDVAYIAESAVIIGDVEIGPGCTIFDNVVIEGFPMKIKIGKCTNIQSNSSIHGLKNSDTNIGDYCTIGHRSIVHGCTLEDYVTVGLGSTIMGKSTLKKGCFVGANALITEDLTFDERSLILGVPGKVKKTLPRSSVQEAKQNALHYEKYGKLLAKNLTKIEN